MDRRPRSVHLDNGNPALFSSVDASSKFMGVTTSKRAGIWTLAIQRESVQAVRAGYLYWGTSRRPALRFSYTNAGVKRQGVISTDDTRKLDAAVALLTTAPAELLNYADFQTARTSIGR